MNRFCKHLLLILLIITVVAAENRAPNITVLASPDVYYKTFYCVANNEISALTWMTPDLDENPPVFNYATMVNAEFECDMSHKNCTNYWEKNSWKRMNSLGLELGPVLDYRWEGFKTIVTKGDFTLITDKLSYDDFNVPFSLRIPKDANIFLCDAEQPWLANCYWFILAGWGGYLSVVRKCERGQIPYSPGDYPGPPCNIPLNETKENGNRVSTSKWTHFVLSRKGRTYAVKNSEDSEPFLTYTDDDDIFHPNFLIIKSRENSRGLWKFHLYNFLRTTSSETTVLGPYVRPQEDMICLALFLHMCRDCRFQLELIDDHRYKIGAPEIYKQEADEWTEIKFMRQNLPDKYYYFQVTTVSNQAQQFWAIGDVRLCTENDIRYAEITYNGYGIPNYACASLRSFDFKVNLNQLSYIETSDSQCPEDTFGRSCIRCNEILSDRFCKNHAVCEITSDVKTRCTCSAGYQGKTCNEECRGNFYGFGCKKKCGQCIDKCDVITGGCANCKEKYSGTNCKIPMFPVLLYPPVINVSHTSMLVQLQSTEYLGKSIPKKYMIYYADSSQMWQRTEEYALDDTSPKIIPNLHPDTKYSVHVLLRALNQNYQFDFKQEMEITTTCAGVKEKDVVIKPANTSAEISIKNSTETCPSRYFLVNYDSRDYFMYSYTLLLTGLDPFSTYDIVLRCTKTDESIKLHFATLEGRPGKVRGLKMIAVTSTTANLTWESPGKINGIFRHYKISYEHRKYLGCKSDVFDRNSARTYATFDKNSMINNLIPYSEYVVRVQAATSMEGDDTNLVITTSQAGDVNEDEVPSLYSENKSTFAVIELKQEHCENMRGPLTYSVTLCCAEEWCSCETQNTTIFNDRLVYYRFPVVAFSHYNVVVHVHRTNGSYFKKTLEESFISAPSAPHSVRTLTLYSKTTRTAHLRWLEPYPPTGELKDYLIFYKCASCRSTYAWNKTVTSTPCKLWPKYSCRSISIEDGFDYYRFEFTVAARNKDPTNWGSGSTVQGKLAIERPDPPTNLTAIWDDYYNLTLSWIHPDITRGPLNGFMIELSGVIEKNYLTKEQLYYTYTIINAPTSSKLLATVKSKNKAGESTAASVKTYSPPKTPQFSSDPYVDQVENHTLTFVMPSPSNLVNDSVLYVIVTELDTTEKHSASNIPKYVEKLADIDEYYFSWIAREISFEHNEDEQMRIVVGSDEEQFSDRLQIYLHNRMLNMASNYTVTFLLSNSYANKTRSSVKKIFCETGGMHFKESSAKYLALICLLILPLLCVLVFILFKKYKITVRMSTIRNFGNTSNPDVVPLAETERVVNRSQPFVKPKPKLPVTENEKYSKSVKLVDFEDYVKQAIETGELDRQHAMFPRGQTQPWEEGAKPYNKSKNRYNNLAAYDHTRVKMQIIDGNVTSGYINANYIEGYNVSRAYIATQGPKMSTVDDFWRMIWQENVEHIIMLANVFENGKKKVEKYWPDINQTLEFDAIKVTYNSVDVFADYEYRKFNVVCNDEERKIKQLHFMSWPDHGVPLYAQSLVPLLRKMLTIPHGKSPVVVHCSAGVGRTGTIILCDICLRMAAREGEVDVLYYQQKIRQQRVNMVDNIEQYKLVHLVLLQCLIAPQTNIPCNEVTNEMISEILAGNVVDFQMKYLDKTAWQDQAMRPKKLNEVYPNYPQKNRFHNILPDDISRVFLTPYPTSDQSSSYINAVKVDGFQMVSKYIVTQQPLPSTLGDFWRLVHEKDISVIVSLNTIDSEDETSCTFWPTEAAQLIQPVPYLIISYSGVSNGVDYDVISAYLNDTSSEDGDKRSLKIVNVNNWYYDYYHPPNPNQLLSVVEEVNRLGKTSNCILVACHDGARASGLFVALTFVIDKIKLEQECDICLAVRCVRRSRSEFVRNKSQFEYLYEAAMEYVSSFEIYSNFSSK